MGQFIYSGGIMDIVWCALAGAFFLILVGLAIGCERLMPRR
jgi:hypothetical protein